MFEEDEETAEVIEDTSEAGKLRKALVKINALIPKESSTSLLREIKQIVEEALE